MEESVEYIVLGYLIKDFKINFKKDNYQKIKVRLELSNHNIKEKLRL